MQLARFMVVAAGAVLLISVVIASAHATTIIVPATANPWLAGGIPGVTTDPETGGGDSLPANGPVEVAIAAGTTSMTFTDVTGLADNNQFGLLAGPDGFAGSFTQHAFGAENGIANIEAPTIALLGVFITDAVPADPAPLGLDFNGLAGAGFIQVGGGISYPFLSPGLFQPFFIGDGLTGTGTGDIQVITVPTGATRLFLGVMDGFGWTGNRGEFEVTVNASMSVIPLPPALALLASAVGLLGLLGWRRK